MFNRQPDGRFEIGRTMAWRRCGRWEMDYVSKWSTLPRSMSSRLLQHDSFNTGGYARNTFLKYDGRLYPAKALASL